MERCRCRTCRRNARPRRRVEGRLSHRRRCRSRPTARQQRPFGRSRPRREDGEPSTVCARRSSSQGTREVGPIRQQLRCATRAVSPRHCFRGSQQCWGLAGRSCHEYEGRSRCDASTCPQPVIPTQRPHMPRSAGSQWAGIRGHGAATMGRSAWPGRRASITAGEWRDNPVCGCRLFSWGSYVSASHRWNASVLKGLPRKSSTRS